MGLDKKLMEVIFHKEELEVIEVESQKACKAGDNFMSDVHRCNVVLRDKNSNICEKRLLIKLPLSDPANRKNFCCDSAFVNEAIAYNQVISKMKDFCTADDLAFPTCFQASQDYTVLQDLHRDGFQMADRLKGLDLPHALIALKELGKFHGTSFAMKHQNDQSFNVLTSLVQDIMFLPQKESSMQTYFKDSISAASMGLKVRCSIAIASQKCFEKEILKEMDLIKNSAFEKLKHVAKMESSLSVISHGDFYINNILFKYDNDGQVEDVMFVDLQNCRYSSLSLDILYFMTTSLSIGVLSENFNLLVETYHDSLNSQIKLYAPSAPEVTLKEIYDELESHSWYGFLMGVLLLPAVTADVNKAANLEIEYKQDEHLEKFLDMLSSEYFTRFYQMVTDFVELGYLIVL